ncbi:hypothetical protein L1887_06064 [Cichorium endivia]|nr:hypothetical protein L1887_06064 [Cichorium endivia]
MTRYCNASGGRLRLTMVVTGCEKAREELDISTSQKLWQIDTVHTVEELKSIIRLLPIISTRITYAMAYSHQGSFTLTQARTMDRHLSALFQIPPVSMFVFGVLITLVTLASFDRLFLPFAYRFMKTIQESHVYKGLA